VGKKAPVMPTDDELVERFIEPDPHRPSDTRIAEFGVPVWALIGYLKVVNGDIAEVASAYEVPEDAVRAAIAFYKAQPGLIDAKLALNAA
jgi:uncharacterized protein (DUF433 family)